VTALWRPGWHAMLDHHLTNVFAEVASDARQQGVERVRGHATRWLRPEGHLPLLRIGSLPYGLLPVTESSVLGVDDPVLAAVRDTAVRALKGTGTDRAREAITRLDADDPASLLAVLAQLPAPVRFRGRPLHGRTQALAALAGMSEADAQQAWAGMVDAERRVAATLSRLGILDAAGRPRLARSRFAPLAYVICAPFLQPGPLSDTDPVTDPTLAGLATTPAAGAADRMGPPGRARRGRRPDAAAAPAGGRRPPRAGQPGLVVAGAGAAGRHPPGRTGGAGGARRLAYRPATARRRPGAGGRLAGRASRGQPRGPAPSDDPDRAAAAGAAKELAEALRLLAQAPSAEVERHVASVVDTTAGRVDAWLGSFAAARLEELRAATEQPGLYLGGWGYLRDIRSSPGRQGAFLHAPSPALATTGAALAQGRRDHATTLPNPLELGLDAPRVRAGRDLLAAVRGGTPLSEEVGHDLERRLRAAGRHDEVAILRQLAPGQGEGTPASQAAGECCDGLSLLRRFRGVEQPPLPYGQPVDTPSGPMPLPTASSEAGQVLTAAMTAGQARLDAAAGLLLAEAVHHGVAGEVERAAATLAAAGQGGTPPAPLEVATADRSARELTLRVAVAGRGTPAKVPTSLAAAAPGLAGVAGHLLAPVTGVTIRARTLAVGDGAPPGPWHTHTLAGLGLDPLLLVLAADGPRRPRHGSRSAAPAAPAAVRPRVAACCVGSPPATSPRSGRRPPRWKWTWPPRRRTGPRARRCGVSPPRSAPC
jgi:hypothetical protein